MTATVEHDAARDAYEALAPFYDTFTAHHDYDLWQTVLLRLGRAHGLSGDRLLDVGCGTGKSFLPFSRDGWRVTACDVSARMLAIAAAKAPADVALHVADARELPRYGVFDLVLLLDDVVNYLTEPGELRAALRGARRNLAPDGVVIFDANTLRMYRTFFGEAAVVEDDASVLVWRGATPADAEAGVLSDARIDAFARDGDGRWERHVSVHRQRHHTEEQLRAALADAGLECVGVYGHGYDGRPEPGVDELRHTKALYIARHGAPGGEGR
jgi:SAM-dependent methyltransferase